MMINVKTGALPKDAWNPGDQLFHPQLEPYLRSVVQAGHFAFTAPAGAVGGSSDDASFLIIHRGRGVRWEVVLSIGKREVMSTMTSDLPGLEPFLLHWLGGTSMEVSDALLRRVA